MKKQGHDLMCEREANSDIILVNKAKKGDSLAFSALYEKYIEKTYKFVYSRVGNRHEAEDLTQIIFMKALESLKNFKAEASFKTWLFQIARHVIMDYWRAHYKNKNVSLEEFMEMFEKKDKKENDNEENQENIREKEKTVQKILSCLPDRERSVLTFRFLKGYSLKETAEELSLSENHIKVIQHRALKKAARINI